RRTGGMYSPLYNRPGNENEPSCTVPGAAVRVVSSVPFLLCICGGSVSASPHAAFARTDVFQIAVPAITSAADRNAPGSNAAVPVRATRARKSRRRWFSKSLYTDSQLLHLGRR